jgi:hypothetical protein
MIPNFFQSTVKRSNTICFWGFNHTGSRTRSLKALAWHQSVQRRFPTPMELNKAADALKKEKKTGSKKPLPTLIMPRDPHRVQRQSNVAQWIFCKIADCACCGGFCCCRCFRPAKPSTSESTRPTTVEHSFYYNTLRNTSALHFYYIQGPSRTWHINTV